MVSLDNNYPEVLCNILLNAGHEGYQGLHLTSDTVDVAFSQLIVLQPRQTPENKIYQQFESDVRYWIGQPPFNIRAPPSVSVFILPLGVVLFLYSKQVFYWLFKLVSLDH